jgi:hypothetical protein
MLEKLWNDIRLIYDGYNFKTNPLVDDLMIVSQDNYYIVNFSRSDNLSKKRITTQIRIEKNYNLVSMWSDSRAVDMTDYKLTVQTNNKIELDENHKIELAYKIITPFLREVKLCKIIN